MSRLPDIVIRALDGKDYTAREIALMGPAQYQILFAGSRYVEQAAFAPGGILSTEPLRDHETGRRYTEPTQASSGPPDLSRGLPVNSLAASLTAIFDARILEARRMSAYGPGIRSSVDKAHWDVTYAIACALAGVLP